ncbi:hypothetical protein K490DRAFT_51040 [Saccharata proteae CBS 121410]|uniref:Snf7-domain-containing protein n=1 Tax=Saccharata proteae CBS 121410 TaxID=1314787 RepID=A0A9P4LV31_9PEZI|nr:hypothetical protein K490DRAFT_51040 [Saccharata proteae CBS 121410]
MSELLKFIFENEEAFKNKRRLTSLYSDFRIQQEINPEGYDANVSAWRKALFHASRAGLIPSQSGANNLLAIRTGDELARQLTTAENGRPLALAAVIQDAVAKKELIPLRDFLGAKTSIYARSWVISPWAVVAWGLRQLSSAVGFGSSDKLAVGEFVVMENVEAASNAILKNFATPKPPTDLIFSTTRFSESFAWSLSPTNPLSPTDLHILVTHLSRDKRACSYDPASHTIKFKNSTEMAPKPITQQDTTIAHLTDLIASLNTQIESLTRTVKEQSDKARESVARGSNTAAKSALRSKKLAEAGLVKRTDTLAQLEAVYAKIEEAHDQVAVVRVMEASAGVLRGLHEEVGGVEGVEGVVEGLREEMGKVDEVANVINEGAAEGVDEGEVEDELEALERAEREEKERVEREEREKAEAERREKEDAEKERMFAELERAEREAKASKDTQGEREEGKTGDEKRVAEQELQTQ